MTNLAERAKAIRGAMAVAAHRADAADFQEREVAHAAKLQKALAQLRRASDTMEVLVSAGATDDVRRVVDSREIDELDRLLHAARTGVDEDAPAYLLSGIPGEIDLALVRVEREVASDTLEAWRSFGRERASEARLELGELLASALGGLPKFERRIDRMETAGREIRKFLIQSEVPAKEDMRRFEKAIGVVSTVVGELESAVPENLRDAIRQAAEPAGLSVCELPPGFIDWVNEVGACEDFRVKLSNGY